MPLPSVLRTPGVILLLALLLAGLVVPAQAAMSLSRTRLIITAKEREASINVRSEDTLPILLQTWVDTDLDSDVGKPGGNPAPFITDPPMFRVEPSLSRQVRVLLVQPPESLPMDRESLFWFNAHETPPRPTQTDGEKNYIQLAFHVRIKLFYRPATLADYTLSDAHKLRFSLGQDEAGVPTLQIHNPAPIHQSISTLALVHGEEEVALDAPMLAPESTLQLPLSAPLPAAAKGVRVVYATIDDNGGLLEAEQAL